METLAPGRFRHKEVRAVKGMAGNIIHAIATTNAVVGGLIVVEAMKLLASKPENSRVAPVYLLLLIALSFLHMA